MQAIVALGLDLIDRPGLHAPHLLVVEGQIKRIGIFDEPIVAHHRYAFRLGPRDGRRYGIGIVGQDNQGIAAPGDEVLHVGDLLGCVGLRVGADVLGAQFLQLSLYGGFVRFPALFLEV